MKWDIYKSLTPLQKEEYNFRFGKSKNFSVSFYFLLTIVFLSIVFNSVFMLYLVYKDPIFEGLSDVANQIFVKLIGFISGFTILLVVLILAEAVYMTYMLVAEKLWLKKVKQDSKISKK